MCKAQSSFIVKGRERDHLTLYLCLYPGNRSFISMHVTEREIANTYIWNVNNVYLFVETRLSLANNNLLEMFLRPSLLTLHAFLRHMSSSRIDFSINRNILPTFT